MVLFKNKPARSSHIEKIFLWTKFQPPTLLLALSGRVFLHQPQIDYPYRWRYSKINQPGLHTLKKYAYGPSFSPLHGSWLRRDPFLRFGHKTNFPYRWRHQKINNVIPSGYARNQFFQSAIPLLQKLRQLSSWKPANCGDPVSNGTERFIEKGNLLASLGD